MPVTLRQIPRDDSGVVKGQFRLRHRNPAFTESLGPVVFRNGVTVAPVSGVTLERTVAMLGHELELEPWPQVQSEPRAVPVPKPAPLKPEATVRVGQTRVTVMEYPERTVRELAADVNAVTPPHEVAAAPEPSDGDLPGERDALVAIAAARGIVVDSSWSRKRLRRAILEHS